MTDAGLHHILRTILDSKTQKAAEAFIEADVGKEYTPFAREVLARIRFKRTVDQNSLIYKWYSEIGKQMGETTDEVRCRAKLDIGCVILCRDDPVFDGFFKMTIEPLTRKRQLKAMRYISMTSVMNTKQATEYLDTFERIHRAEGYQLSVPEAA